MKSYKIIALASAVLALVSCSEKATVKGVVEGAGGKQLSVRQLNVNTLSVLDTVKLGKDGSFSYSLPVKKGQPEFVYLYYGQTQVGSFLLETGETATVAADTLGNYTVEGSEGSVKLSEVSRKYSDFQNAMADNADDVTALGRIYLSHYRECVKYVMTNTKSLTVIPVLYENVTDDVPVFSQPNDAILFRNALDSLKTVYPGSRYVKALEVETQARMHTMAFNTALANAPQNSFPELSLPDMKGVKVSLSAVDAKVILVHFWDASDAAQKMYNVETLLPLYNEFHSRGLEIYSVCLSTDKAEWGSTVVAQKLPWINVNDGKGIRCPAVTLYSVTNLPSSLIIADGELETDMSDITDMAGFKRKLARLLAK